MTERALTKEQIINTFQPQVVRREPRPDRVGREGVPAFIDFVEFRDEQGRLRYATPADHYEGPQIGLQSDSASSHVLLDAPRPLEDPDIIAAIEADARLKTRQTFEALHPEASISDTDRLPAYSKAKKDAKPFEETFPEINPHRVVKLMDDDVFYSLASYWQLQVEIWNRSQAGENMSRLQDLINGMNTEVQSHLESELWVKRYTEDEIGAAMSVAQGNTKAPVIDLEKQAQLAEFDGLLTTVIENKIKHPTRRKSGSKRLEELKAAYDARQAEDPDGSLAYERIQETERELRRRLPATGNNMDHSQKIN